MHIQSVELFASGVMRTAHLIKVRTRLPFLLAESFKSKHPHNFRSSGTVYDLLAKDPAFSPKADTVHLPSFIGLSYLGREFVISDVYIRFAAFFFGQ